MLKDKSRSGPPGERFLNRKQINFVNLYLSDFTI